MGRLSATSSSFPIGSNAPGSMGFSTHEGHGRVDRCLSVRRGCQVGTESEVERGQQVARESRDDSISGKALGKATKKEGRTA